MILDILTDFLIVTGSVTWKIFRNFAPVWFGLAVFVVLARGRSY